MNQLFKLKSTQLVIVIIATTFLFISNISYAKTDNDNSGFKSEVQRLDDRIDNVELTPGPQGEKGDTGLTGLQGEKGDTGDAGSDGAPGDDGIGISSYEIGDIGPGDGIVFFVSENGQHGLEAAPSDQSPSVGSRWYRDHLDPDINNNVVTNATRAGVKSGLFNTERIIITQGVYGLNYAALICQKYLGGGYGNWYLPSKDELNKMYLNKEIIGNFESAHYWSSTESGQNNAWSQNFFNGAELFDNKETPNFVRAIRYF